MNPKTYLILAGLIFPCLIAKTQPITDSEALVTGHRIEMITNSGNAAAIDHFLYPDSLLGRIRQKSHSLKKQDIFESFRSSFIPSFAGGGFGKQIMAGIRNGNYRVIREYDDNGVKHLVFRLFGDGGINYHDFILARVGDSIKAADLYTYSLDEWTSGQIARLTDIAMQSSTFQDDAGIIKSMNERTRRQDYAGIKDAYDRLDKKYQHNKVIQLMYIHACHHIDLGLYEKALVDYSASYPDASSCYLLMIDLYYLQKQYDKALIAVDKLDKLVGGDPLLNFFRANICSLMGKNAESLEDYEKVYRYDPSLKINAIRLASSYAAASQKDKARAVIKGYMNTPSYHPGDLNALYDQYPELR